MKTHNLKLSHEFWDAVMDGVKTFEVRKNDRGFNKGDKVIFSEVNGNVYTTKISPEFHIDYVLNGWGIEPGYVVFSIKEIKK